MENQKTKFNSTEELLKQKEHYLQVLNYEIERFNDIAVEVLRKDPNMDSVFTLGMEAKSINLWVERLIDVEQRIFRNEFIMPGTPMYVDPKTGEAKPLSTLGKR